MSQRSSPCRLSSLSPRIAVGLPLVRPLSASASPSQSPNATGKIGDSSRWQDVVQRGAYKDLKTLLSNNLDLESVVT